MTFRTLGALVAAGAFAGLIVHALLLWIAGKLIRATRGTIWRSIAATWLVVLATLVTTAATLPSSHLGSIWLPLNVLVGGSWVAARWALGCDSKRALAALGLWIALDAVVSQPAMWLVRRSVLDTFTMRTGHMAPVILGDHVRGTCASCGVVIELGHPSDDAQGPDPSAAAFRVPCPSCGTPGAVGPFEPVTGDSFAVDRTTRPVRWDAVAFASSLDGHGGVEVQRLVGLPGETIEIREGDVFADGRRMQKPWGAAEELWITEHEEGPKVPSSASSSPWSAASGAEWSRVGAGWCFSARGDGESMLRFAAVPDVPLHDLLHAPPADESPHDVRVDCVLARFRARGVESWFGVQWEYRGLIARSLLSPEGDVELTVDGDTERLIGAAPELRGARLSFAVRDGRLLVAVGDQLVASRDVLSLEPPTPDTSARDDPTRRLALVAARCELDIAQLRVLRDVHYHAPGGSAASDTPGRLPLGPDECWVIGDNSAIGHDARWWTGADTETARRTAGGTVRRELIRGVVRLIHWPPERWRYFAP